MGVGVVGQVVCNSLNLPLLIGIVLIHRNQIADLQVIIDLASWTGTSPRLHTTVQAMILGEMFATHAS